MAGVFDESTDDFGIPGLDDWYDKALASGQGFKSEEERQAYIKSLGDPEKHPMFATSTEDLEGNPLVEALRSLREEGKSATEVATMYKDEGNEWIKKGDTKSMHEAYSRYTHALNVLDGAVLAAASGVTSEEKNEERKTFLADLQQKSSSAAAAAAAAEPTAEEADTTQLRSQILSNRAMASLNLKNYGSCRNDADAAIKLWSDNIKAHYRKTKALCMLKKYEEALLSSAAGLAVDPGNAQIIAIQDKCQQEVQKVQKKMDEKKAEEAARRSVEEQRWLTAWEIITGCVDESGARVKNGKSVAVGFASTDQQPAQLKEIIPHLSEGRPSWPVLMLYPQYGQLDVIQGVSAGDMVVAHLAEMFPELEDGYTPSGAGSGGPNPAVPWDRDCEYFVSRLAVYAPLEAGRRITTVDQWYAACREQSALRGEHGPEAAERALLDARKRSQAHETKLFQFKDDARDKALGMERVGYVDVHLGCTFYDVLRAPNHVLSGGLLSFLVFVRGNQAHKKFLSDVVKNGHGIWVQHPAGSGQSGERLV